MVIKPAGEQISATEAALLLPSLGEPSSCAEPAFFSFQRRETLDELSKDDRLVIGTGISRDSIDRVTRNAVRLIIERFSPLLEEAHRRIRER
jgi:hypothetical protein